MDSTEVQVNPRKHGKRFRITVEPVAFMYAFGMILHQPVIQQYVYKVVGDMKGFHNHQTQKTGCDTNTLNITLNDTARIDELRREVQSLSSIVTLFINLCSSVPGLIVALFFGAMIDRVGRRPAVLMPALGTVIEAAVVLLVMYFDLPVYILLVGALVSGMCGSFTVLMIGILTYISDMTDQSNRAIRLAVLEGMVFLGGCVSYASSGAFIKYTGFITPYWVVFACQMGAFLYGLFILKESMPQATADSSQERQKTSCIQNLRQTFNALTMPRKEGKLYMAALLVAELMQSVTQMGLSGVLVLFALDAPFCMSSLLVGYFMAFRMLVIGIGAVIGLKVLPLCRIGQPLIGCLSVVSLMLFLFTMGFSTHISTMFLAPIMGIFSGAGGPILKGLLSKTVGAHEQGALFTGVVFLDNLSTVIAGFSFNALYSWCQKNHHSHGLVFNSAGFATIIALVCFIYIHFAVKKYRSRELLQTPTLEEDTSDHEKVYT